MAQKTSKYRFNYSFLFCFIFSALTFIFFPGYNSFASTQVVLEWTPNSESDLAGYKVFCREEGQSYGYSNPSWEGTDTYCTIYDLDETKTYCFVARAYNTEGFESGDSDEVCHMPTVMPDNQPPIANAGPDQTVDEGQLVNLNGSNSTDPDDGIASYHWVQISGLVQEAEYGVLFGAFETFSDSAASGGQYVQVPNGADIRFDGPDEAHKIEYTFDVPEAGIYRIKGWVHAANGADDSFWVRVNGRPAEGYLWDVFQNTSYQADNVNDRDSSDPVEVWLEAGENTVNVYLRENGTRLDKIELEPLEGFTGTLSDPSAQRPTFTAPNVGADGASLIFELTVADHNGLKSTDSCVVNVTRQNEPPEANAGFDQTVGEGVVVRLDGTSSIDIDDGIASYLWTQIGVPKVTLSNPASSQPTFTAPNVEQDGASLNFNLTVTDAGGMQKTDSCIVNVSWKNEPPTAVVAPDYMEPIEGTLVALDGSASMDPDDGIASHLWTQVEGDPVSLSDPKSAVTTFTAPKTDQHGKNLKFKLTVKDFGGLQGTADSAIYVIPTINEPPAPTNNPPTADYSFAVNRKKASFTDNSSETDGTIVSWFWSFGDGSTSTERNPKHRYVKFRNYSVILTVTDDNGATHSTSKNITITK